MSEYKVFHISCDNSNQEILTAELANIGFEGFLENDQGFEAYIPTELFVEEDFNQILEKYDVKEAEIKSEIVEPQNWNKIWESSFEPVIIDDDVVIKTSFHNLGKKYDYEILIHPKTSFGTGHHETTQLIIELMKSYDFTNKSVLDYGCGTGVLSIFASMLKAENIFAFDIDDWAFENVAENCKLNGVQNVIYKKGDLSIVPDEKYHIILANINKNILRNSFEKLSKFLDINGLLLISGFFDTDLEDLNAVAENYKFKLVKHISRNNWCAASFAKIS